MAPSWFSKRTTSNDSVATSRSNVTREKALPSVPPSLNDNKSTIPTPQPDHAGRSPAHHHSRSASQPIPKIFSRKKSTNNLRTSQDDGLDVIVDGSPLERVISSTNRHIGSRKGSDNVETRIQRRCMCCDNRVKVPEGLDKFRCMACLTINDLKPFTKQTEDNERRERAGLAPVQNVHAPPLTVERTKALLERCLMTYLENRSKRQQNLLPHISQPPRPISRSSDRNVSTQPMTIPMPPSQPDQLAITASPPVTPSEYSEASRGLFSQSITESPKDTAVSPSIARKPVPTRPSRRPPPPPGFELRHEESNQTLRPTLPSKPSQEKSPALPSTSPRLHHDDAPERQRYERIKMIFKPLDDYIVATYGNMATLNSSFSTVRPVPIGRARSESHIKTPPPELAQPDALAYSAGLDELDAKMLLLGDIGENGSWWTGKFGRQASDRVPRKQVGSENRKPVSSKSPNINWSQLSAWYDLVHTAGVDWQRQVDVLKESSFRSISHIDSDKDIEEIEQDLREAREHTVRVLLKVTENVLKRPGKLIKEPEQTRFLLIMLANPSFYSASAWPPSYHSAIRQQVSSPIVATQSPRKDVEAKTAKKDSLEHAGLLKRIFGLLAYTPDVCHRYIVGWLSKLDEDHFRALVDLCSVFVNYRLSRKHARPGHAFVGGGLIPDLSGGALSTSVQLHSAMGLSNTAKKRGDDPNNEPEWATDWQIKAAAKCMNLLFAANSIWQGRRKEDNMPRVDSGTSSRGRMQEKSDSGSRLLPISAFYNIILDSQEIIADFKVWESRKEKFAFCQYPLFLSIAAKSKILEYDAKRQMEIKARDAIFDQVFRQRENDGYLNFKVRRDCLVEDSLRQISEAVGAGSDELKKGLRIQFANEEGVDAGGLRKEWFLVLAREVLSVEHGLFVYDEQSHACYFNPHTFETSDQFYLVGALLGLAIYNSIILDLALPSFAFRKLMAAAPQSPAQVGGNTAGVSKAPLTYTLADLAEYKPALASGLQQLLDFEGDVESTYCWSFVAPIERYGIVNEIPLVPGGDKIPVTNDNRGQFVEAYVRYLLDTAVARQFEPFKRGFFTVCAGNALSLFRAEEIELLIRGSDEALDVKSLRAVAVHDNWRAEQPPHAIIQLPLQDVDVVRWFWEAFEKATSSQQRKLLAFITSSDRIPAVGVTSLVLRIVAGGDGWSGKDFEGRLERLRYPVARTCFNMLVLWKYESKEELEQHLWRAVEDSEGFGLK